VAGFVWVNDIAMTSMDNLRLCDLLIDKPANRFILIATFSNS
jgi:CheY-like chemotaxis protein